MSTRSGFTPLNLALLAAILLLGTTVGAIYVSKHFANPKTQVQVTKPSPTSSPTPVSPSASPTSTPSVLLKTQPLTPIVDKTLGTITNHVEEYATTHAINTGNFILRIDNKTTGERFEQKGPPTDLVKTNLQPGPYRVSVYYPSDYWPKSGSCNGCVPTWGNISESSMQGYEYDLKAGETIRFITGFEIHDAKYYENLAAQNPANQPKYQGDDHEAPHSNVFWPQNGGTMTYRTDGKFCVIMNAPTDNKDQYGKIDFQYRFDNQGWSSWRSGEATFCSNEDLSNGQHTYEYHSKDTAGNEEAVQKLTFTVAI